MTPLHTMHGGRNVGPRGRRRWPSRSLPSRPRCAVKHTWNSGPLEFDVEAILYLRARLFSRAVERPPRDGCWHSQRPPPRYQPSWCRAPTPPCEQAASPTYGKRNGPQYPPRATAASITLSCEPPVRFGLKNVGCSAPSRALIAPNTAGLLSRRFVRSPGSASKS